MRNLIGVLVYLVWMGIFSTLAFAGDEVAETMSTPVAPSTPAPLSTFFDALRDGGRGPEMLMLPAGRFRMGCVSGEHCFPNERPVHTVEIAAFALSKYEITFDDYDRFRPRSGREFDQDLGPGPPTCNHGVVERCS